VPPSNSLPPALVYFTKYTENKAIKAFHFILESELTSLSSKTPALESYIKEFSQVHLLA